MSIMPICPYIGPFKRCQNSGCSHRATGICWWASQSVEQMEAEAADELSRSRDEALSILRRECQLDENGDNNCGAGPYGLWETGYCAGLRTAYRALENAAPQDSVSARTEGDQSSPPNQPAAAAPLIEALLALSPDCDSIPLFIAGAPFKEFTVGDLRDLAIRGLRAADTVVVPREPTSAMIKAGNESIRWYEPDVTTRAVYRAMLAAAPKWE